LNTEQTRQLREDMEKVKEPLAKARALLNYRNGRYRVNWALDYDNSTLLPCHDSRTSFNLLWHDALLRTQDGDFDGALTSVLSILAAARSIGNEPCMISQLVRIAGERSATDTLERILAQGEASPNSLANVQRAFENEASQPLFLFGVRGERAGHHQMMAAIESGK